MLYEFYRKHFWRSANPAVAEEVFGEQGWRRRQQNNEQEEEEEPKQEEEEQKGYPILLPAWFPCSFSPDRLQVWGTPGTLLTLLLSVADSKVRWQAWNLGGWTCGLAPLLWLGREVQPDRWSYVLNLNK